MRVRQTDPEYLNPRKECFRQLYCSDKDASDCIVYNFTAVDIEDDVCTDEYGSVTTSKPDLDCLAPRPLNFRDGDRISIS